MANLKFSGFTAAAAIDQTDSFLVGFDTDGGGANPTNNKWTFSEVAAGLAAVTATPFSIYAADGTIGTTRKALITDTIQFRDSGDTYDILKLHTDGTFALGRGASTTVNNQVAIGNGVTASGSFDVAIGYASTASAGGGMAIGRSASSNANGIALGFTAGSASGGLAIGYASKNYVTSAAGEVYGIALGFSCKTGALSVGIGDNIDISSATNAIAIGSKASSTGNNSITFNSNGTAVSATTANAFGVYMSSNTTPDFEVVGGGESTLNTSLKITGQGYTEQHDQTGVTISWNNSNVVYATLVSGSQTFTPSDPKSGATYILYLRQPAAGAAGTVDWNSLVLWSGGTAPTLTATNGATDVITLIYNGTSTKYFGTSVLNFS